VYNRSLSPVRLGRAWRAIIARAEDFSPEANAGLHKGKLSHYRELRKGSPRFGCQTKWRYFSTPRCDCWKFPRRVGRCNPERTHREMLNVVSVDCDRRLWLVLCAGRTDTGCWQPKSWLVFMAKSRRSPWNSQLNVPGPFVLVPRPPF